LWMVKTFSLHRIHIFFIIISKGPQLARWGEISHFTSWIPFRLDTHFLLIDFKPKGGRF
jgi:hypothetical protein